MNTDLGQYQDSADSALSEVEAMQKKLYGQIMHDVNGAIREIVENLRPAHTQLYKVMFDG